MKSILTLFVTLLMVASSAFAGPAKGARPGKLLTADPAQNSTGSRATQKTAEQEKTIKALPEALKSKASAIEYIKDVKLLSSLEKVFKSKLKQNSDAAIDFLLARSRDLSERIGVLRISDATVEAKVENARRITMLTALDAVDGTYKDLGIEEGKMAEIKDTVDAVMRDSAGRGVETLAEDIFNELKRRGHIAESEAFETWMEKVIKCLQGLKLA